MKMCTRVSQADLVTMHHEMTHIEYFLEYRNLHKVFRDGANPGTELPTKLMNILFW